VSSTDVSRGLPDSPGERWTVDAAYVHIAPSATSPRNAGLSRFIL